MFTRPNPAFLVDLKNAIIRNVDQKDIVSEPFLLHSLDLSSMKRNEQDFTASFNLIGQKGQSVCSSIVLWFDTEFSARFCKEKPKILSTDPKLESTHWAQTVLPLEDPIVLNDPNGGPQVIGLEGKISFSRQKEIHRTLDIFVEYTRIRSDGTRSIKVNQLYSIGVTS